MRVFKTVVLAAALAAGLAWSSYPVGAQTLLKIDQVPASTPPTDTLFVAGSFNNWNRRKTRDALFVRMIEMLIVRCQSCGNFWRVLLAF